MNKMDEKTKKMILKMAAGVLLLAVFLCFSFGTHQEKAISYETAAVKEPTPQKEESVTADAIIYVDVSGCVKTPGVYSLNQGGRVFDAIALAGGITPNAETKGINLAQLLKDEQKIYIPNQEEFKLQQKEEENETFHSGKININLANSQTLQTLNGIGPSTAEKIIAYRNEHGAFQSVEDLTKVSGIGLKTLEKWKEKIVTE